MKVNINITGELYEAAKYIARQFDEFHSDEIAITMLEAGAREQARAEASEGAAAVAGGDVLDWWADKVTLLGWFPSNLMDGVGGGYSKGYFAYDLEMSRAFPGLLLTQLPTEITE